MKKVVSMVAVLILSVGFRCVYLALYEVWFAVDCVTWKMCGKCR